MTTINCSENCIYQKDGKCSFENICMQTIHANSNCAYFVGNNEKTQVKK